MNIAEVGVRADCMWIKIKYVSWISVTGAVIKFDPQIRSVIAHMATRRHDHPC